LGTVVFYAVVFVLEFSGFENTLERGKGAQAEELRKETGTFVPLLSC